MSFLEAVLGALLMGAAFMGWVIFQRKMRDDDTPLFSTARKKQKAEGPNDLEAFIAAYRSGKVDPSQIASAETGAVPQASPSVLPERTSPQSASGPAAFLRPEVKLAYLTIRAGLRDHHAFANVRLSDLGRGETSGRIDILVCNAQFVPVAAVDVSVAGAESEPAKTAFLREAGIRYLRFSARSMPRPADLQSLIYRT